METPFDFNRSLMELLIQIPEGRISTYQIIAQALGDCFAEKAVKKSLNETRWNQDNVVEKLEKGVPFSGFVSEKPLEKLRDLQLSLSHEVITKDEFTELNLVAGVDVAYHKNKAYVACVVMDSQFNIVDSYSTSLEIFFPYIPTYLSFREAPPIFSVLAKVSKFDAILVNGHGVAHPRGCGLATYVGLKLRKPTIGVARNILVGEAKPHDNQLSSIIYEEKIIGKEIITRSGGRLYVSVGNMISLSSSCKISLKFTRNNSLPEPLMKAHNLARDEKNKHLNNLANT
jgi:deoxyribonuclease V